MPCHTHNNALSFEVIPLPLLLGEMVLETCSLVNPTGPSWFDPRVMWRSPQPCLVTHMCMQINFVAVPLAF